MPIGYTSVPDVSVGGIGEPIISSIRHMEGGEPVLARRFSRDSWMAAQAYFPVPVSWITWLALEALS